MIAKRHRPFIMLGASKREALQPSSKSDNFSDFGKSWIRLYAPMNTLY